MLLMEPVVFLSKGYYKCIQYCSGATVIQNIHTKQANTRSNCRICTLEPHADNATSRLSALDPEGDGVWVHDWSHLNAQSYVFGSKGTQGSFPPVAYPGIRKRGQAQGAAPGQGRTLTREGGHVKMLFFVCAAGNHCLLRIICYIMR